MNYLHKEKERMRHQKQLKLLSKICSHIPRLSHQAQTKVRKLRRLVIYAKYMQTLQDQLINGCCKNAKVKATKDIKATKHICESFKVVKKNEPYRRASKAHIVFLHSAKSEKSNDAQSSKLHEIRNCEDVDLSSDYKVPDVIAIEQANNKNMYFDVIEDSTSSAMISSNQLHGTYEHVEPLKPINMNCSENDQNNSEMNSLHSEPLDNEKENLQPTSIENLTDPVKNNESQKDGFHEFSDCSSNNHILKDIIFSKMNDDDDISGINASSQYKTTKYFSNQFEVLPVQYNPNLYENTYYSSLDKYTCNGYELFPSMCYTNIVPIAPVYVNHTVPSLENLTSESYSSTSTEKMNLDTEDLSSSNTSCCNNTNDDANDIPHYFDYSSFNSSENYNVHSNVNPDYADSVFSSSVNPSSQFGEFCGQLSPNIVSSIKFEPVENKSDYGSPLSNTDYNCFKKEVVENNTYSSSMYNALSQPCYETFYPSSYVNLGNSSVLPSIHSISNKMIYSLPNVGDDDSVFSSSINDGFKTEEFYAESNCDKVVPSSSSVSLTNSSIGSSLPREEISYPLAQYFSKI